jgi:hypothetical protein
MPDEPTVTAEYETLLKYAARPDDTFYPEASKNEYKARELLGLVQPEDRDALARLGEKIDKQGDDQATWLEMINDLFELKPSLLGITFNVHGFFKEVLARQKQKRKEARR